MADIRQGQFCSYQILVSDGQLCPKVCEVTQALMQLGDQCFSVNSLNVISQQYPRDVNPQVRAAKVGSAFHAIIFNLASQAQASGQLEQKLKITPPVGTPGMPVSATRGPDFVLSGWFDGEDLHAAWDFTTDKSLAAHYDRDVKGIRKSNPDPHPIDPEIQEVPDKENYWSSYIAILY